MVVLVGLTALALGVPAALAWPGRPATPTPKAPSSVAPPPAWIETSATSAWLAYGSYCWTGGRKATCADMIPPQSRPDLPVFSAKRGRVLRVHFSFKASSASVSLDGHAARAKLSSTRRVVSWSASRDGILTVFVRVPGGDASYHARLRLR